MKPVHRLAALLLGLGLCSPASAAQEEGAAGASRRSQPWPEAVVDLAESLPVQDGGRVKPLGTFSAFTLLRLSGRRSLRFASGERLGATEWLLDTLFYPRAASDYPLFLVQDAAAIEAIGLAHDTKKKRDRWSFNELRPGMQRLFELGREYGFVEAKQRSSVQQQVFQLAGNVDLYMQIAGHLDFARQRAPVPSGAAGALFAGRTEAGYRDVVERAPELLELYRGESAAEREAAGALLGIAAQVASTSEALALIPPVAPVADVAEWKTPGDLFGGALQGEPAPAEHLELLSGFERLVSARDDAPAFERALGAVHAGVLDLAGRRGEYAKIGLEVAYYRAKLLRYGQIAFLLAFLAAACMWLLPRLRALHWTSSGLVLVATGLLVAAIVMRCVIRARPPVSTLYETVLFVTATGCIVALFIEAVGRRRIAVSAAALLGTVGLFIANGYETLDKQDTMPSLVAVLDTNFWLATHVTAITIGYSAGMLAALLASGYLLAKAVRWRRGDRAFYGDLGRMVYGVLCFGLIFSLVGTILGGIWANESWGRFWGWDPKENGALLIVISQIAILHGRMGGYLREHGVCMAAAFGGTVVAFSWWGVNLLGVGLHSYGFTSGIHTALWSYYAIQWGIVGIGGLTWLAERRAAARRAPAFAKEGARAVAPAPEKPSEPLTV